MGNDRHDREVAVSSPQPSERGRAGGAYVQIDCSVHRAVRMAIDWTGVAGIVGRVGAIEKHDAWRGVGDSLRTRLLAPERINVGFDAGGNEAGCAGAGRIS